MLCFEKKMRNHRYTYENNFRIKKNFLKYLIRRKNHRFLQWTSIFQYDIGRFDRKNPTFFSKSPADRLKWCRIKLEDYENPSVLKYIFSLPRYIDYSISAECVKAKYVNFAFWLLIKDSEKCFGIWKLFSYVFRSFCIRFFIRNCFVWNLKF